MNEGKNLSRGLHYTYLVLSKTIQNDQALLLIKLGYWDWDFKVYWKFVKQLKKINGYDLKHLVSDQVFFSKNIIFKSGNKAEWISQQLPKPRSFR